MFALGDLVQMKKPHACQTNRWEVVRMGADIKIKCMGCGHVVMFPRREFTRKLKKVLQPAADVDRQQEEFYLPVQDLHLPPYHHDGPSL